MLYALNRSWHACCKGRGLCSGIVARRVQLDGGRAGVCARAGDAQVYWAKLPGLAELIYISQSIHWRT